MHKQYEEMKQLYSDQLNKMDQNFIFEREKIRNTNLAGIYSKLSTFLYIVKL